MSNQTSFNADLPCLDEEIQTLPPKLRILFDQIRPLVQSIDDDQMKIDQLKSDIRKEEMKKERSNLFKILSGSGGDVSSSNTAISTLHRWYKEMMKLSFCPASSTRIAVGDKFFYNVRINAETAGCTRLQFTTLHDAATLAVVITAFDEKSQNPKPKIGRNRRTGSSLLMPTSAFSCHDDEKLQLSSSIFLPGLFDDIYGCICCGTDACRLVTDFIWRKMDENRFEDN